MCTRRFFAYCVVAAWIGLTPVTVKTALDWSTQESIVRVGYTDPSNAPGFDARAVNAFQVAEIKRIEFWWEAAIWAGLTLIGAALLAEPRNQSIALDTGKTELSASSARSVYR